MNWHAATVITQAIALLVIPAVIAVVFYGLREAMAGVAYTPRPGDPWADDQPAPKPAK